MPIYRGHLGSNGISQPNQNENLEHLQIDTDCSQLIYSFAPWYYHILKLCLLLAILPHYTSYLLYTIHIPESLLLLAIYNIYPLYTLQCPITQIVVSTGNPLNNLVSC